MIKKTSYSVMFWKRRIYDIVQQYNLLSEKKMNYEEIDVKIAEDINMAMSEYSRIRDVYCEFIKERFISKKRIKKVNFNNKNIQEEKI